MHDILRLFLTRIFAVGLVIVSSLVVGEFPIELRNASAITLFTVGVPSVLLAVWAPAGRTPDVSLVRTLIDFVVPAAAASALLGLVVFYGTLLINPLAPSVAGVPDPASLAEARSALTTFLVLSGLLLVPFVAPPIRWFAVVDPLADDLRPAVLALILAAAFLVVALTPVGRAFFDLVPIRGNAALLVVGGIVAWFLVVRTAWKLKLLNRFFGA
jgi:cation-transporting ATPase E